MYRIFLFKEKLIKNTLSSVFISTHHLVVYGMMYMYNARFSVQNNINIDLNIIE